MAEADELEGEASAATEPQTFPALVPWLATMAGLSLFAILVGGMLGFVMVSTVRSSARNTADAPVVSATKLIDLPPIVTNLADPPDTWVRLAGRDRLSTRTPIRSRTCSLRRNFRRPSRLHEDLTVAQIGGASGLQHLREDLTERAPSARKGMFAELIIQTLVVQ